MSSVNSSSAQNWDGCIPHAATHGDPLLDSCYARRTSTSSRMPALWPNGPRIFPQTFLNAMDVGIDYLWTNALCIVQNDKDIQSHLANMVIVYGNAELTIESTTTNVSVVCQAIHRLLDGRHRLNTKPTFMETLKGCPWESLAWTLQEKFSRSACLFSESQAFGHPGHRRLKLTRKTSTNSLA
jgi:hypothetical protein